ncbi:MAG: EF-hand domain-containing protein [Acidimicrobiales bacterium]
MADAADYAASFDMVDGDGDGYISAAELQRLMQVLGDDITAERAAEMIRRADSNGDGLISLDEFAAFMRRGGA